MIRRHPIAPSIRLRGVAMVQVRTHGTVIDVICLGSILQGFWGVILSGINVWRGGMQYAHWDECEGNYHGNSSKEDWHTPMMTWNVAQCVYPARQAHISCHIGDLDKPGHVWEWSSVSQLWLVNWTPVCSQPGVKLQLVVNVSQWPFPYTWCASR